MFLAFSASRAPALLLVQNYCVEASIVNLI